MSESLSEAKDGQKRIRAARRLSALKVSRVSAAGMYEDGEGLRLVVTVKGVKRWTLRVTINGRRVERGLGVWPDVSLEDARAKAAEFRCAAREGRDLRTEERARRSKSTISFRDAFEAFFAMRRQQLSNKKHIQQWQNTMRDYVFPIIGSRPVAAITPAEVLHVLEPIWYSKPETASRVLQRMSATFESANLRGTRERANPCIGIARELGAPPTVIQHHRALPWRDVPAFVQSLIERDLRPTTRLAMQFLIHTATRSVETRCAQWSEFNLDDQIWIIPANRMKSRREHIAPLSNQVVDILRQAGDYRVSDVVFPGQRGQALSDNTLSKLMRASNVPGTPHGFRSSFKDWASETGVRDEVSECVLAHTDPNPTRAAYRRTNFLDERKGVMRQWSSFVSGGEGNKTAR